MHSHFEDGGSSGFDRTFSSESGEISGAETEYRAGVWEKQRILSLDGDHLNGFASLCILQELMKLIRKDEEEGHKRPVKSSTASPLFRAITTQDEPQDPPSRTMLYRPCHYFDLICGVSMGGIAAVLVGIMRFSVEEAIARCEKILVGLIRPSLLKNSLLLGRTSSSRTRRNSKILKTNLESQLEQPRQETRRSPGDTSIKFGRTALTDIPPIPFETDKYMCQTIVYATHVSRKGVTQPYAFRSYASDGIGLRNSESDTRHLSLVDVCRATIAARAHFDGVEIGKYGRFRDGGSSAIDLPEEVYDEMLDRRSIVDCLLIIGSAGSEAQMNLDGDLKRKAQQQEFKLGRFDDSGITDGLSDNLEKAFEQVKTRAAAYCAAPYVASRLQHWAKLLVRRRRRRAKTGDWDRFVGLGMASCPMCSRTLRRSGHPVDSESLTEHIRNAHPSQSPQQSRQHV